MRERERGTEREREGLRKSRQTLRQEAAVPEVAATAEAQSFRLSWNLLRLDLSPVDRS